MVEEFSLAAGSLPKEGAASSARRHLEKREREPWGPCRHSKSGSLLPPRFKELPLTSQVKQSVCKEHRKSFPCNLVTCERPVQRQQITDTQSTTVVASMQDWMEHLVA